MTPVLQTITACPERGDGHDASGVPGNCFQAAVASLLDLFLDEVPHFLLNGDSWFADSQKFVHEKTGMHWNYFTAIFPFYKHPQDAPSYVLMDGKSPRGDFYHVVVADAVTGEMVHDPHPSGDGLLSVEGVYALYEPKESQ